MPVARTPISVAMAVTLPATAAARPVAATEPSTRWRWALPAVVLTYIAFAWIAGSDGSTVLPRLVDAGAPSVWSRLGEIGGLSGIGVTGRIVLTAAAILALLAAFVLLLVAAKRGACSLRSLVVVALGAHVLVLAMPLLYSRDVYSYVAYGRIAAVHGENPYVSPPATHPADPVFPLVGEEWRDTTPVYGPAFTALSIGIVASTDDVASSVAAFRGVAVAASALTTLIVAWVVARWRPVDAAFAVAALGLNPCVLFQTAASGHNDLLVALGVASSFALVVARRHLLAIGILTAATLVKVTAGPALVVVLAIAVRRAPRRRRFALTAAFVVTAVTAAFVVPFMQSVDPTLGQVQLSRHEGWFGNGRILREIASVIDVPGTYPLLRLALIAVLLIVTASLAVTAWRSASGRSELALACVAWSLAATLLLIPALLPWYLVWALPLIAALGNRGRFVLLALSFASMLSLLAVDVELFPDAVRTNVQLVNALAQPAVFLMAGVVLWNLLKALRDPARTSLLAPAERAPLPSAGP